MLIRYIKYFLISIILSIKNRGKNDSCQADSKNQLNNGSLPECGTLPECKTCKYRDIYNGL